MLQYFVHCMVDPDFPSWIEALLMFVFQVSASFQRDITIDSLSPHTTYSVTARVCTAVGCAESLPLLVTTEPGLPEGMQAPVIVNVTTTEAFLAWSPPERRNGIILRLNILSH